MKRRIRKILLRFLLFPILLFIILIVAAVAILYNQQQRLVGMAVNELNKQLPGRLIVGGSEISAFQNFPYISIGLKDVKFYATKAASDKPIYEAERMFTGFSLSDILKQQYHVKVIALRNGHLDLVQDSTGELNIVKASKMAPDTTHVSASNSTPLDLAIKKIVLKNMTISYLDKHSGQHIISHIEKIHSSVENDSARLTADLQGGMELDYTRPGDTTLFRHKHLETDIKLAYEKPTQLLKLSEGRLKLEEALFDVTGTADLLHDLAVDIHVTGDKPDFSQLFSFAPAEVAKELKNFKYDGHLAFDCKIKGKLKGGQQPLIELSFSCTNAWLHNTKANKKLDSLNFKGFYTNGASHCLKTSELRMLNMSARPGEGLFKGDFVLRDFTNPKVSMRVNSELELSFIGDFLGIRDLQRITGHISLKMNFKELVDLNLPGQSMDKLTQGIQSELTVRNLTFRIPNYPYNVENLDLHAAMKDGFVKMDSLTFKIGHSDFHMDASISDLPALFHHQEKPVQVTFNAHSNKIILRELLNADTNRNKKAREEIYGFNVGLALETSVNELLHPSPLPKGKFTIQGLNASFARYPHAFHDFGAALTIEDTTLRLKNFAGRIDSSDIRFSGKVNNYALWFSKAMRGRTQIAFDLKSQHLAMRDLLGRKSRKLIPKDYREEVGSNIWLRSKIDLKYDSIFRFANVKIANISGELKKHAFKLDSVSGNVKFGIDNFVKIDTLKGTIGNSDFNISMRLYTGKDTNRMKKENYLQFSSRLLDVDQLTSYRLTEEPPAPDMSEIPANVTRARASAHDSSFNIFQIPFIDFNASVNIGKIKYKHLWMKNFFTNIRMQTNQQLYLDTLAMDVAEGRLSARAHFNGSNPDKIYLRSRIHVQNVNIEKMMLKLDYLGQDFVINKNIKGHLTGEIKSYVQVHPDLTPLMDHTQAEMDIAIYDGMLVNFTPIKAMSSYFSDKNLNIVRFDTLRDKLSFKDGALNIPSMNINSSLGFMEISGTQSLDTHMEYYIRIPLKLVTQVGFRMLFGKKKE
ncbi:MAG TPA: AsmA-like C-terminal region-containing protein, partial [Puia sp.]